MLGLGYFVKTFIPSSNVLANGVNALPQMYMGVKYNANQSAQQSVFQTFEQFGNTQYSTIGKLSEDQLMLIECSPAQMVMESYFVDNAFDSMTSADGDRRFLDLGIIQIGLVNPNANAVLDGWVFGELYVIYDILISKPELHVAVSAFPWEYSFVSAAAGGWWTAPDATTLECAPTFAIEPATSAITFSTDANPVVTFDYINFNDRTPGVGYDIEISYEGTVATAAAAFTAGTILLRDAVYMPVLMTRDALGVNVAHVATPQPADVTTGNTRVSQRICIKTLTPDARLELQLNHSGYPGGTQTVSVTIRQFDPQDVAGTVATGAGLSTAL